MSFVGLDPLFFDNNGSLLRQRFAEETKKIFVHDGADILLAVAADAQHVGNARKISDGIEVHGRLLAPEPAIEIRADARMTRIASELADVVDMLDDFLQLETDSFGVWLG